MSQKDDLLRIADNNLTLFHDSTTSYMAINRNGYSEVWPLRSRFAKHYLAHEYHKETDKVANSNALQDAINTLIGQAQFVGKNVKLHNRIAWHENAIWYDLSNDSWQAIKITSDGWSIEPAPVLFRRYQHQIAQVIPQTDGDVSILDKIFDYVNVYNDKHIRTLFKVYLISNYIPGIAHPIGVFSGVQGAAKSTASKICKSLIDPSRVLVTAFSKEKAEIIMQLDHNFLLCFDNISSLSEIISDMLCRAVSGEGFSKRELYTDDDDILYTFQRNIILNGINQPAQKPDLLDRCIHFELHPIKPDSRKADTVIWSEFDAIKPQLMGVIFNTLSRAMKIRNEIVIHHLPRMADFALWGYAITQAMGFSGDEFIEAYALNMGNLNEEAINANILGEVILKFMETHEKWEGTTTDLLSALDEAALECNINTKTQGWPRNGNGLSRKLNVLKTNLAVVGITIEKGRGKQRLISIRKTPNNCVNSVNATTIRDTNEGVAIKSDVIPSTIGSAFNPTEDAESSQLTQLSPSSKENPLVMLAVIQDIPEFINPHNPDHTYQLKAKDVVSLPNDVASILVKHGHARILSVAGC